MIKLTPTKLSFTIHDLYSCLWSAILKRREARNNPFPRLWGCFKFLPNLKVIQDYLPYLSEVDQ